MSSSSWQKYKDEDKEEAVDKDDDEGEVNRMRKEPDKEAGLNTAVEYGIKIALRECQHRFKWSRWNCSESIWLANTGTKESGYVGAILSASVTYSIAKACARGNIANCGCAPPTTVSTTAPAPQSSSSPHHQETFFALQGEYWRWGGCSADVDFASKLARKMVKTMVIRPSSSSSRNGFANISKGTLQAMNAHNRRIGRTTVHHTLDTDCKCHGVSGSCTLKTCWMKLAQFGKIGRTIYAKYKKARMVRGLEMGEIQVNNKEEGSSSGGDNLSMPTTTKTVLDLIPGEVLGSKPSFRFDLVYLTPSPTYCDPGELGSSFSYPGTKGRPCLRHKEVEAAQEVEGSCEILCCGRGYNTHIVWKKWKCNCTFQWCCNVECQDCQDRVQMYTCN